MRLKCAVTTDAPPDASENDFSSALQLQGGNALDRNIQVPAPYFPFTVNAELREPQRIAKQEEALAKIVASIECICTLSNKHPIGQRGWSKADKNTYRGIRDRKRVIIFKRYFTTVRSKVET